jgi:hypothetical protein
MKNKNFLGGILGTAISIGVLFGTVWLISRAWKSGQK